MILCFLLSLSKALSVVNNNENDEKLMQERLRKGYGQPRGNDYDIDAAKAQLRGDRFDERMDDDDDHNINADDEANPVPDGMSALELKSTPAIPCFLKTFLIIGCCMSSKVLACSVFAYFNK